MIKKYLLLLLLVSAFLIGLDWIWMSQFSLQLYASEFSRLLRLTNGSVTPIWLALYAVYGLLILGIFAFVLPNSKHSITKSALLGGLFGLVVFGIYDLSNYAIIKTWPLQNALIDAGWGIILCGGSSSFACLLYKLFGIAPTE